MDAKTDGATQNMITNKAFKGIVYTICISTGTSICMALVFDLLRRLYKGRQRRHVQSNEQDLELQKGILAIFIPFNVN